MNRASILGIMNAIALTTLATGTAIAEVKVCNRANTTVYCYLGTPDDDGRLMTKGYTIVNNGECKPFLGPFIRCLELNGPRVWEDEGQKLCVPHDRAHFVMFDADNEESCRKSFGRMVWFTEVAESYRLDP